MVLMKHVYGRMIAMPVIAILTALIVNSCENETRIPYPDRARVSDITVGSARVSSQIILDASSMKECGFCWNTKGYPRLEDSHMEAVASGDRFTAVISNLSEGTRYYVRAYSKSRDRLIYGEVTSFVTLSKTLPSVTTPYIFHVTHDKVLLGGGGVSDNTFEILSRGICWSTEGIPTLDDQKMEEGKGFERFSCTLTGLAPGTVYYIRAWATNSLGLSYGGTNVIRTYDGFTTDYDGHVYSTVKLGNQEWLNRNLETTHFQNGDPVPTTTVPTTNLEQQENPVYQWGFLGFDYHVDDDGRLYTWYAATDTRKICPAGWHIPSVNEWKELIDHLGGDTLSVEDLNQNFNFFWNSRFNISKSEGSFWPAQPGTRTPSGEFRYHSRYGSYWWTGNEINSSGAKAIFFGPSDFSLIIQTERDKKYGFSIRCVKD